MPTVTHSISSSERLQVLLERIDASDSQGHHVYTRIYREQARASARQSDLRMRRGEALSPLDGALVSIKDLFDVAGETTMPGTPLLARRPPATQDAALVARLRQAGAVIVGKTQMTELAFSGLGLNGHERLLGNPADLSRITGGSSSGAAASVAAGLAELALGTDTGGSVRIPASLCGVVGFKPTFGRLPNQGAFPLSTTLDCAGPLARTVLQCREADAVLSGAGDMLSLPDLSDISLTLVGGHPMHAMDPAARTVFDAGISRLSSQGARIVEGEMHTLLNELFEMDRIGVFTVAELLATLAEVGIQSLENVDPMIVSRIEAHRAMPAVNYVRISRLRAQLVAAMDQRLQSGEILLMPTVPVFAPRIADVSTASEQLAANQLLLHNARSANLLDLPAISLPLPYGELPFGLMLMGRRGEDARLLAVAQRIEEALV